MPSTAPSGEAIPSDGPLTDSAKRSLAADPGRTLGWYLHVPFCSTRCGYCDFNTYTRTELGGVDLMSRWADDAVAEIALARTHLGSGTALSADTVFIGGGTPTLLPPADLGRVISAIDREFGLTAGAEITVEANPDTVDSTVARGLADAGVNRVSLGVQSTARDVLRTLERTHDPNRVAAVVAQLRDAGIDNISVDLIYATPGESERGWERTLADVVSWSPDHVSAYCLVVEDGTALARRVRSGLMPPVDDDIAAVRYEAADRVLGDAGYRNYEISNWARPGRQSRHNLRYWHSRDWWGVGPGAHSHIRGVRWWNHRHPARWSGELKAGGWPAVAREVLDPEQRLEEEVMLRLRLAEGLPWSSVPEAARDRAAELAVDGLLVIQPAPPGSQSMSRRVVVGEPAHQPQPRVVLTPAGRLLADHVILELLTAGSRR